MNTKSTVSLDLLMLFIKVHYPFDDAHYPGFDALTPEKQQLFALNHTLKHIQKSVGNIATGLESVDHGGAYDAAEFKAATAKFLVNALKLAETLGMSAEELAALVPKVMK